MSDRNLRIEIVLKGKLCQIYTETDFIEYRASALENVKQEARDTGMAESTISEVENEVMIGIRESNGGRIPGEII